MQTPEDGQSLINPIGYRNNSCGYCHAKSGSFSYYAAAISLQPKFYEDLLDRGWRRSGTLLYKPDQRASCCPQYTIRLDSESFHATKDQRQAINRFSKYIVGADYTKEAARLYPRSREEAKKRDAEFDLLERVHECEKKNLRSPPEPSHALTVTLEPDNFTEEKYAVFENYQRIVHKEPPQRISKFGFKNFLCSSPLPRSKTSMNGREQNLGSYHQCYRIDGRLVAVGVLDLLPQCVSAVYFMYHESVHQHNFGKLGALREIALAKESGAKWWYAGFYIHSCKKMRYKADYTPQYLLDPESYDWNILNDVMKKKLDAKKYVSLSHGASDSTFIEESEVKVTEDNGDGEDSDDDSPVPFPDMPIFSRGMPGVLTKSSLLTEVDLDHIKLNVYGQEAETCDLAKWEIEDMDNPHSLKGTIAELAAAVGPELAAEMVVAFK
ncbi:arginine-tRNA-protein transferase-like protein 1 [Bisporella sp. PMI_857]|nr:arginine-tRNA-protein transferase-like protein 1 [Bisporella sp. PMI_857]